MSYLVSIPTSLNISGKELAIWWMSGRGSFLASCSTEASSWESGPWAAVSSCLQSTPLLNLERGSLDRRLPSPVLARRQPHHAPA